MTRIFCDICGRELTQQHYGKLFIEVETKSEGADPCCIILAIEVKAGCLSQIDRVRGSQVAQVTDGAVCHACIGAAVKRLIEDGTIAVGEKADA